MIYAVMILVGKQRHYMIDMATEKKRDTRDKMFVSWTK